MKKINRDKDKEKSTSSEKQLPNAIIPHGPNHSAFSGK